MKCRKMAIDLLEGSQEGHGHRCRCPRPATFQWKANQLPATYPCGLDVDLGKLQVSGWELKKKGEGAGERTRPTSQTVLHFPLHRQLRP